MDPSFSWTILCSSAQSHAAITASGCSPEVAEMILAETAAFCRQAAAGKPRGTRRALYAKWGADNHEGR